MGIRKITAQPRSRAGRKRGITLNNEDIALIQMIAKNGLLSFLEIRAQGFKNRHRVSVWRRMKRLVRTGYLNECRGDSDAILGWSITPAGAAKVFGPSDEIPLELKRSPIYRTSFNHDRFLRSIRRSLEHSSAIIKWIPEHVLKAEIMRKFHYLHPKKKRERLLAVPDALLYMHTAGVDSKAVIELELTQKSRRRLYQKIEACVLSPDFDYTFFIVKDEHLMRYLVSVYQNVVSQSVRVKISKTRNGIYFATLDEVLKNGVHAKFSSLHDTLSFADLPN